MFLPHLKLNQTRTASALAEPEPQPLATVAAVHAIEQRSASGPQPVTLSTGRVIVPDVRNSVVTHWNVADNPDAEMTEAEDTEFCQIQADRRKAKQNADFLAFVDKRERAKAEFLRQHATPSAGFLEPAGAPAVEPVPAVRPSALSTAAADGFRPTVYASAETDSCEASSLWFKQTGRGLWRFYVYTDERDCFSVVGPHYRTKAELLADLERYATDYGFASPPAEGFLAAESATVRFRVGDSVGMNHSIRGPILNLTVHAIKPDNMIMVAEPCGYSNTPTTWIVPAERLFKR